MVTRYAVTGATGFIGSHVVAELVRTGAKVLILARPSSDLSRLESSAAYEVRRAEKLNAPELVEALRGFEPQVFIHCAWRGVARDEINESSQVLENIPMTLATVELALASGCKQWVGLGSQAEYGNPNRMVSEEAPLQPTTIYGKAKLAAGIAATALCDALKIAGSWLRVFSAYGPGDAPERFAPYVIQQFLAGRTPKLTGCEQLWDYLFVQDAARAIVAVADGGTAGVFNLGSGVAHPLRKVIETIKSELHSDVEPEYGAVPYRPDQVMHLQADINRLVTATKWKPQVELAEGIRATIAFERTRSV